MADAGLGKQFQRAQKQLNEFQRGVKSIGTRKDSAALREKLDTIDASFRKETMMISKALRSAASGPTTSKLAKDLRVLLEKFEEKVGLRAQMERKAPLPDAPSGNWTWRPPSLRTTTRITGRKARASSNCKNSSKDSNLS